MRITPRKVTVEELSDGYVDDGEGGVRAYSDRLDVRPPYQRDFVYKDKQRDDVVRSVMADRPLNVMYWNVKGDGTWEVIDGQQRTISICQYVNGDFSIDERKFFNLTEDEKEKILGYELLVYECEGTDSERLDWFETINIAGEKLTPQELRNAVYPGPWLTDAKRWLSKTGGPGASEAEGYVHGVPKRQELLEKAIEWKVSQENHDATDSGNSDRPVPKSIGEYMAEHQWDADALPLWHHFQEVTNWARQKFPKGQKRYLEKVPWDTLWNEYHNRTDLDPSELGERVSKLMADREVQYKPGIYSYVLDGKQKHLNLRRFDDDMKAELYEENGGICHMCEAEGIHRVYELSEMEADHIIPWSKGGKTVIENCQLLCKRHNAEKGAR